MTSTRKTIRILAIEDNPLDSKVLLQSLKAIDDYNPEVIIKSTLSEGIFLLEHDVFDLVFLDLFLSDSQGIETVKAILNGKAAAPVVVLSGMEDIDLALEAIRLGAKDYIRKVQISPSVLSKVITYALEKVVQENEKKLILDILALMNWTGDFTSTVSKILEVIRRDIGVEGIGMRFRDGIDFPFLVTSGLSEAFLNIENSLCRFDAGGSLVCDEKGCGVLECVCGMVIQGKTDPLRPFFTEGGSFIANSADEFEKETAALGEKASIRNTCFSMGFESVAIIPIRIDHEIIGSLQLNDSRKNRFTADMTSVLEKIVGHIGMALKRNAAEQALKESEERLHTILENIQAGVVIVNPQTHRIVYVNRNALVLTGREAAEVMGSSCFDFICPNPPGSCPITDMGKQFVYRECEILHKSGRCIPVIKTVAPVQVNNSSLLLETFIDITHQKDIENKLVKEKEHAEESDRLKSAFINNISHEVRTPLNGILGFSTMLIEDGLLNDEGKEFTQVIESCSEQLLRIMTDIMDYSLIESSGLMYEITEIPVKPVLDHSLGFIRNLIAHSRKPLEVILQVPPTAGTDKLWADSKRLQQVMINLLDNAHKFTAYGQIEFGYRIHNQEYTFFVKDTGIGIAPEKLTLIFEKFRQVDDDTSRKYGGTGLGLPICRGIVTLLGGSMWVESVPGSGSGFYFTVPG
jgi:PAS domain S-box-containing protein